MLSGLYRYLRSGVSAVLSVRGLQNAFAGVLLSTVLAAFVTIPRLPNHLEHHNHWLCSKAWNTCGMMGGEGIWTGSDVIIQGHINLGSWMGFHELLFHWQLKPEWISFRFMLASGSTLTCVFDKDQERFEGIRLSANPDNPNAYIRALDTGEFTEKKPFESPVTLKANTWHQARVLFLQDTLRVQVDGETVSVPRAATNKAGWVGFRSGYGDTFLDTAAILEKGSSFPYRESFHVDVWSHHSIRMLLLASAYILVPITFTIVVLRRQWRLSSRRFLVPFGALVVGVSLVFLDHLLLKLEPPTMREMHEIALENKNDVLYRVNAQERQREFEETYMRQPASDTTRIVFLGTSQTFGAGARDSSESFIPVLQKLLDARTANGRHVECVNAAIQGSVAKAISEAYAETFIHVKPALTVVNLSCNDSWDSRTDFADSLKEIIRTNKAAGVKTLLVAEAVSPDVFPNGLETHEAMKRVAAETGVPFVNAYAYLKQHRDDGFLFWDRVHPTSYGHRLLAECLLPAITAELGISAIGPHPSAGQALGE